MIISVGNFQLCTDVRMGWGSEFPESRSHHCCSSSVCGVVHHVLVGSGRRALETDTSQRKLAALTNYGCNSVTTYQGRTG